MAAALNPRAGWVPGRPGLTHGVGSAGWAGPRHMRLQLRHPSPPRGLLCAHPSRARTHGHAWPDGLGRTRRKGLARSRLPERQLRGGGQAGTARGAGVSAESALGTLWRPSALGPGPRSLLRAHRSRPDPARSCSKDGCGPGAGVSPSPRHRQAQPRPQSLAPVDTQCPSPRPPSTSKHPGPVHIRSPYRTPEAPLGGHGLSHEPRNSPNRPREPTGPGCPAANHDLAC